MGRLCLEWAAVQATRLLSQAALHAVVACAAAGRLGGGLVTPPPPR